MRIICYILYAKYLALCAFADMFVAETLVACA